mmetsp:Transcript_9046/g.13494  ORF Transcript_9046/g.13494 Transcript_9046/m.13494 type:complete len:115 (+) Transcript_9046:25-369(+)
MGASESSTYTEKIKQTVKSHPVVVYSTTTCSYCYSAKSIFQKMKVTPYCVELNQEPDGRELAQALYQITKMKTVPNIFITGSHIGGATELAHGVKSGHVQNLFKKANIDFEDII